MERGEKAIFNAKVLLKKVQNGTKKVESLKTFEFPPIYGPGLDAMTERETILVRNYEKLFPERPREKPLTNEEKHKLLEEATKDYHEEV